MLYKFLTILAIVFLTVNCNSETNVPEFCHLNPQDLGRNVPPPTNRFTSILQQGRNAVGEMTSDAVARGYFGNDMESALIRNNPSYGVAFGLSGLFAPILSRQICPESWTDENISGALNHFLLSAFLSSQIGQEPACKLVMAHEIPEGVWSNSIMDVRNNLVGIEVGARNRAIFSQCFSLMQEVLLSRQRNGAPISPQTAMQELNLFGSLSPSLKGLSDENIMRRFGLSTNNMTNNPYSNACLEMENFIKTNVVSRLTFYSKSGCSQELGVIETPRTDTDSQIRDYFNQESSFFNSNR